MLIDLFSFAWLKTYLFYCFTIFFINFNFFMINKQQTYPGHGEEMNTEVGDIILKFTKPSSDIYVYNYIN